MSIAVKSRAVDCFAAVAGVRHHVVWLSTSPDFTILSTSCGCTADDTRDHIAIRGLVDCPTCIPFRRTR
jgi:hypothetical protein